MENLKKLMDKHYPPFESLQLINSIKEEERQRIKEELFKILDKFDYTEELVDYIKHM